YVISSITKLVFIAIEAPLIWFAWVYLLDAVVQKVIEGVLVFEFPDNWRVSKYSTQKY
ncbi:hypothetical protein THIOM_004050, partial [Candidatus Thiomargarita nelsonii]